MPDTPNIDGIIPRILGVAQLSFGEVAFDVGWYNVDAPITDFALITMVPVIGTCDFYEESYGNGSFPTILENVYYCPTDPTLDKMTVTVEPEDTDIPNLQGSVAITILDSDRWREEPPT